MERVWTVRDRGRGEAIGTYLPAHGHEPKSGHVITLNGAPWVVIEVKQADPAGHKNTLVVERAP